MSEARKKEACDREITGLCRIVYVSFICPRHDFCRAYLPPFLSSLFSSPNVSK
jgi:hypothetical protein